MKSAINKYLLIFLICNGVATVAQAQNAVSYNLAEMLKEGKIQTIPSHETKALGNTLPGAVTTKGINWLKGVKFKEGKIDIDMRGKNVFLQSFLGIALHGTDTTNCDILYFRPFNFRHADTARRRWSVAYMSLPDFNYARLRKEHPLVYENSVTPVPSADDWFHATLILKDKKLSVYVDHSPVPSLVVTLIGKRDNGLFGLYADGLTEDFANLAINPNP